MQELHFLLLFGGGLLLFAAFWALSWWSSRCIRRDLTWHDAEE